MTGTTRIKETGDASERYPGLEPGRLAFALLRTSASDAHGADPAIMSRLTRVLRPGAALQLLVSSTVRDRGAGVPPIQAATLQALAESYATWGLAVTEARPATVADVAHSSWGKRLGAGTRRPAWLLRARFAAPSWQHAPTGSSI
jgi:hypothetical protein